jgi:hypothetical protein
MINKNVPYGIRKYLFLLNISDERLDKVNCCWPKNVKLMNQILSVFGIFGSFGGIYLGIISNVPFLTFLYIFLDLISLYCCISIFVSTFTKNFDHAYYPYIISVIKTILYIIVYLFYFILVRVLLNIKIFEEDPIKSDKELWNKFGTIMMYIPLSFYFLWFGYVYCYRLYFKKWALLEGKEAEIETSKLNDKSIK